MIPEGVNVTIQENNIMVSGPKGTLERMFPASVKVGRKEHTIRVESDEPALWGTWRAHVANMVKGVTEGFTKQLEIHGIGYKAQFQGNTILLSVGFSHPVSIEVPEGVTLTAKDNVISISGCDKEKVGQFASFIRSLKPPDVYKGKGIRYVGEVVKLKPGKKVGVVATQ